MAIRLAIAVAAYVFATQANARTIQNVVILETGRNSNSSDQRLSEDCKKFNPTARQVKEFFTKAYIVPNRFVVHDRFSPCYASGTLEFSDYGKVNWSITSGGAGGISWYEGEGVYLYYRSYKWFDPMACTYGDGEVMRC